MKKIVFGCLCFMLCAGMASAQVGIFDQQADWTLEGEDNLKVEGSATSEDGVYTLQGNGDDIWNEADEGFYLYTEKEGSWTLTAKATWVANGGGSEWSKLGLMVREDGEALGSKNFMVRHRGNNMSPDQTGAQWRLSTDGSSGSQQFLDDEGNSIGDQELDGIWLRLARNAMTDTFYAWYSEDGSDWNLGITQNVEMDDLVSWGLTITNHEDNEELAEAIFENVTLEEGAPTGVLRELPDGTVVGGDTITVNINIANASPDPESVSITEVVPDGWSISNVSHDGSVDGNTITWELEATSGMTSLSYEATSAGESQIIWNGTVNGSEIGGDDAVTFLRARTPAVTDWNPPTGGWDYIFDPDIGSTPDLELEGWKHDNNSDAYIYQPTIPEGPNEGEVWRNPGLIDDEMGGETLLIYDPGDPRNMDEYGNMPDPSNRKVTINYNLGETNTAVAAFRVRSTPEFVDQFGVEIPFGYEDEDEYPLLGLAINENMTDLSNWEALSASGLFFSNQLPNSLNFPSFSGNTDAGIEAQFDDDWDNTEWHEYWITWNFNEGEKATALYVDGELQPKFSFPIMPDDSAEQAGAFFNRYRDTENDITTGNTVFRITFRQTPVAGNLQFDYIALKAGTDEPPTEFTPVKSWELY